MVNARFPRAGALALGAFLSLAGHARAAESPKPVTFAKDVAPILQAKCETCHRKGTSAPMSLVTYAETRPWAKSIRERVITRNMPPWHIDKTVGIQQFQNDRSLTDAQIDTIVRWVNAGAPLGDAKDLPPAKVWPDEEGWQLAKQYGAPDLVIKSEPYTMPAQGQDVWWKPLADLPMTEARWVRAVEMRPATPAGRRIVHHALAQLEQDEPGAASVAAGNGPGLLMEWAIGKQFDQYRPNTGKLLLPGSKIRWDIHFHAVGEPIRDHVELAIYLYPKGEEPKYRTRLSYWEAMAASTNIDIPPNTIAETQGFHVLKEAARLENFQPHMHLRGKAMSMEAILPDGTTRMLSYVDHFNFNWMNNYIYTDDAAPVLPKGTMIRITAWWDNTAANPNNPDPEPVGGLGRSHGRRNGARLGQRHLPHRAGLQGLGREEEVELAYADMQAPRSIAILFASCVLAWAQPKPLAMEPIHDSGQSVTGAFEGWFKNPDGSFSILLGYFNRNLKEELDIPIGPDNRIEPGGPDQGQPTHFLPRRQWGVFTVTVPKDFGNGKLTWTLVANHQTTTIPASLDPLWEVSPFKEEGEGNTPPVIRFEEAGPTGQGPRAASAELTAALPNPLTLTVWVGDDAKTLPAAKTLPKGPPVTVTWGKFRGPGAVTFANNKPAVEKPRAQPRLMVKPPPPRLSASPASTSCAS